MKTKLLFLLFLITITGFAQKALTSSAPAGGGNIILSYYTPDNAAFAVLDSGTAMDQSPSGANATWAFNDLTVAGASIDTQTTPTAGEVSAYPNTTNVSISTVDGIVASKMYTVNNGNLVSVTGIESNGVVLKLTNNATIGQFPTYYSYSNSDTMGGTYVYDTYNGNFTGTINTSEDAYGTLNLTIDGVPSTYTVNRLKSVQHIVLTYLIFNVGTIDQTIYSYYEAGATAPIFRNSSTHIVVPAQSIDTTVELIERFVGVLGVPQHQLSSKAITIYPNPVENVLNFKNDSNEVINNISISDSTGRNVMQLNSTTEADVSSLQKGVYFATFKTNSGTLTQKFIKK